MVPVLLRVMHLLPHPDEVRKRKVEVHQREKCFMEGRVEGFLWCRRRGRETSGVEH
jgi:hypothetical protein